MRETLILPNLYLLLIALFPVLAVSMKHGASTIFLLLSALGLFSLPTWRRLSRWEKEVLLGFCIVFLLATLSLINSQNLSRGLSKLERYTRFLCAVLAYLGIRRQGIYTEMAITWGCVLAALVLCGQAIYHIYFGTQYRVEGAYHSIIFGVHSTWILCVLICSLVTLEHRKWETAILCIAAYCAFYATAASGTRGAWLFIPVILIGGFIACDKTKRKRALKLFCVIWLFGLISAPFILPEGSIGRYRYTFEQFIYLMRGEEYALHGQRLLIWQDSLRMFQDSPFFGTGLGDIELHSKRMIADGTSKMPHHFDHAHNVFIDSLARSGLFGLIGMMFCVFLTPFRVFFQKWKAVRSARARFLALAGMMSVLGFAVFGLTEGWLSRMPLVTTYVFGVTIFLGGLANAIESTLITRELGLALPESDERRLQAPKE